MREDASFSEVAIDSVEEMGLGLAAAALLLFLLGRIDLSMEPMEIVGKIVAEGLVMSIGVSIGTAQFGKQVKPEEGGPGYRQHEPWRHLGLAACGAVVFAANVAPTEEIVILAGELTLAGLLCVLVLSILIGAMILHYSDFTCSVAGNEAGVAAVVSWHDPELRGGAAGVRGVAVVLRTLRRRNVGDDVCSNRRTRLRSDARRFGWPPSPAAVMKSMGHPHKNRLEWLVFAASLLVIASIVGLLVYGGLMTRDAPAQLQVFLGEPRPKDLSSWCRW